MRLAIDSQRQMCRELLERLADQLDTGLVRSILEAQRVG